MINKYKGHLIDQQFYCFNVTFIDSRKQSSQPVRIQSLKNIRDTFTQYIYYSIYILLRSTYLNFDRREYLTLGNF